MPNSAANVSVGKPRTGGAIFRAPVGTALPTTATAELNVAFVCVGYISEDGVTHSSALDTDTVKAWGGDNVYTIMSGRDDDWSFTMIETMNTEAMKIFYGDENVSGDLTSGITIMANAKELGSASYVIDEILRNGRLKRIVLPDAQVSDTEDVTYKDDELVGYGVTLTANQDSAGNTHYEYIAGDESDDNSTP